MPKIIERKIIVEFIKALGKSHTYNMQKNTYLLFGILWGVPVPIVTIGIGLYYKHLAATFNNIISEIRLNPLNIFFLIHPLLFGIVFGAMGTIREDKEKEREGFEASLININKKLKDTNKRLHELDELKDNFLSMVSHELWSPLATIQGYISFMEGEKSGPLNEKQKELLAIVGEQAGHLNYLIEELVDISKIESGKFEVKLDCLDIADIETRVVDSLKRRYAEKNIIVKNEVPPTLPYVLADKERIIQVFINILGNAIKFTPERGTISISARKKEDAIEFAIRDTGIGIPPDKLDKIFDKFYQADSSNTRTYGGCGLGLAITKSIIELHKGKLWVESEAGKGSTFFFELMECKEG